MPYEIVFTPDADARFESLPPMVASRLLDELDRLADDPDSLRVQHYFPYRPAPWIFECGFEDETGDLRWSFRVGFDYGPAPKTLTLLYIAAQSYEPRD